MSNSNTEAHNLKIRVLELVAIHPNHLAFKEMAEEQKESLVRNIIESANTLIKDGYTEYESITSAIVMWMPD